MSKAIAPSEVSAHNSVDTGLYIIIDSNVYDMTGFVDEHPGGAKILKRFGGKDASKQFWKVSSTSPRPLQDDVSQVWDIQMLNAADIMT